MRRQILTQHGAMTTRTKQLEWTVMGLAITSAAVSLILIATGDVAIGGLGVVGALVLWVEGQ